MHVYMYIHMYILQGDEWDTKINITSVKGYLPAPMCSLINFMFALYM